MHRQDDQNIDPRYLSATTFHALGLSHVAFIKRVIVNNAPAYAIHAADGRVLGGAASRNLAIAAARQFDLEPVDVH